MSFAEFHDEAQRVGGLSRAALRRSQGRPRAAAHAEQPAVHDRLLRHPARQRRGRALESDESDAGDSALRAGCAARPRCSCRRSCTRASSRCSESGDLKSGDRRGVLGLPEGSRRRLRCRISSPRRASTSRRAGVSLWKDALAGGLEARPADRRAGRSVRDALYLRHHRPAQGLHAHAPHRHAYHGGAACNGSRCSRN